MKHTLLQDTPEWHDFRQEGIGSSDIAAIMGKSPYKTAVDVYYEKCGLQAPHQTAAMKLGKEKEGEALELYNFQKGANFSPYCFSRDDIPFFRASLDGYYDDADIVIEIKTPSSQKSKEEAKNGIIPEQYIYQIQWQLYVTKAEKGVYLVYDATHQTFILEKEVFPDKELHEEMMEAGLKFWTDYEKGICPEVEERCIVIEDPNLSDLVKKYKEVTKLKEPLDEAASVFEKQLKGLRSLILDYGDDGSFQCDGLTAKCIMGKPTYDIDRMKRDGIDVSKYIKKQASYFRISLRNE